MTCDNRYSKKLGRLVPKSFRFPRPGAGQHKPLTNFNQRTTQGVPLFVRLPQVFTREGVYFTLAKREAGGDS